MGYPAERPAPRPRIPTRYVLFQDEYHDLTEADAEDALSVMDAGLIREGYSHLNAKIPKPEGGEDELGYDTYGWGEHISRKYAGQRRASDLTAAGG
ncbi:MAG: hypothetical protein AB1331_00015 [Bacillota bacterium]